MTVVDRSTVFPTAFIDVASAPFKSLTKSERLTLSAAELPRSMV